MKPVVVFLVCLAIPFWPWPVHGIYYYNSAPAGGGGGTIAFGAGEDNGVDSGALAVTLTGVSVGDLIFIGTGYEHATSTFTAPVESGGAGSASTWVAMAEKKHTTGGEPACRCFYTLSSQKSGSVTYTMTPSNTPSFSRVFVARATPSGGTVSLDTSDVDNEGSGTAIATGAVSSSGSAGGTITFGFCKGFTGITFSSPLIGGAAATITSTAQSDTVMWYKIGTVSSGTAAITASASDLWVSTIVVFKM